MMMIENKINYFAMHTNFDVAVMAEILPQTVRLKNRMLQDGPGDGKRVKGHWVSGTLDELTLAELAALVRKALICRR